MFNSSTPSSRAQELYYRFLGRITRSTGSCQHIVLIAGNHDSPSLLDAPKGLLQQLNVHVVGGPCDPVADEAIMLYDRHGASELILCAVPFLRDRDLRTAKASESIDDKNRKLVAGLRNHYAAVAEAALNKKNEFGADLPIVAMATCLPPVAKRTMAAASCMSARWPRWACTSGVDTTEANASAQRIRTCFSTVHENCLLNNSVLLFLDAQQG